VVGSYRGSYIGGTPKYTPFRCNKLTALPLGVLMGLTRRSMKNRHLTPDPSPLRRGGKERWKRALVD